MTYVNEGELINITCIVEGGARVEPPENIFWYRNGEVISAKLLSNMFTIFTGIIFHIHLNVYYRTKVIIFLFSTIKVISYFSDRNGRGGVSIVMEKVTLIGGIRNGESLNGAIHNSNNQDDKLRAVSSLLIRGAHPAIDEGRYTCSPSDGTNEASTRVYILEGKHVH